jgi:Histidinol-phosphate/aromatic aminotransferase and cobyric acid decarboxylase
VPLGAEYAYDVDALAAVARRERARVVVLNSPNNPTGSVLPADGVATLLERTESLLLCDEAYQDFGGPTALTLLRQSPRIVVLRTLSKAMGMAGLRFGYALAHPDVAREIAKAKLPYNVNAITLAAAEVMLKHSAGVRRAGQGDRPGAGPLPRLAGLHRRAASRSPARPISSWSAATGSPPAPFSGGWWRSMGFWCGTCRAALGWPSV